MEFNTSCDGRISLPFAKTVLRQYYLGVMDTPSRFAGNKGSVDVCSDGEGCGAPGNEGARVSDERTL